MSGYGPQHYSRFGWFWCYLAKRHQWRQHFSWPNGGAEDVCDRCGTTRYRPEGG